MKSSPLHLLFFSALVLHANSHLSQADISIEAHEAEGGVVFSYTGSLRASELKVTSSYESDFRPYGRVAPYYPEVEFGPADGGDFGGMTQYGSVVSSRPTNFGNGDSRTPTIFGGDYFSIGYSHVAVPENYVDGTSISGAMTFQGSTFANMGLNATNGVPYVWFLENNETVTLLIDSGPSTIVLRTTLDKKLKKLKSKLKGAKRSGKKSKAKKIKKQIKSIKKQLRTL